MIRTLILASLIFCMACQDKTNDRPNILWIVAEDLGPYIPPFGDSTILTPNLSELAAQGVCFEQVYSPSPVCAPSRAALATGMYPTRIGANHMRTGPWYSDKVSDDVIKQYARYMPKGIVPYESILPEGAKMFTEFLRLEGYYCTNNAKEDYQFRKSPFAWDESSSSAHWRKRKKNQPFFSVVNLGITHESQIWARAKDSLSVNIDIKNNPFPYLPNTDSSLMDIKRMYSNIAIMDAQVGEIMKELQHDGLLDKTIVFWFTDHGGPLPRQKRLLYDSGTKVPMIIRFPKQKGAGTRDKRLISFIDFAPTILSLAGIKPPKYMDGTPFLGKHARKKEPSHIFSASDRFDESYDAIRAVRNNRYKYILYLQRDKPMFLHVNYRDQMPIMRELYREKAADRLNDTQMLWFRTEKPPHEFFDTENDPHEINDLSSNPDYSAEKEKLAKALEHWLSSFEDLNRMPETELIKKIWKTGKQPKTSNPQISVTPEGETIVYCQTNGATIGYKLARKKEEPWKIYSEKTQMHADSTYAILAHRIGYLPSDEIIYVNK